MNYRDFEDYLSFIHAQRNPELLDDELPDAFGEWMDTLSVDEWIEFADKYASHAVAERMEEIRKLVEKDRPMFFRNNIVELMQLENIKKVRKQLRKEILDDISSLTPPATEEKENL